VNPLHNLFSDLGIHAIVAAIETIDAIIIDALNCFP
jgi:hypothetical protein